jgi:hypothetical protein
MRQDPSGSPRHELAVWIGSCRQGISTVLKLTLRSVGAGRIQTPPHAQTTVRDPHALIAWERPSAQVLCPWSAKKCCASCACAIHGLPPSIRSGDFRLLIQTVPSSTGSATGVPRSIPPASSVGNHLSFGHLEFSLVVLVQGSLEASRANSVRGDRDDPQQQLALCRERLAPVLSGLLQ